MSSKPDLLFDREIRLGLPLSGHRLVPGVRGASGLPLEAFLRLYGVDSNGRAHELLHLRDVLALVQRVESEEQAWQLLQLETAPETHFMFEDSGLLEVRVVSQPERPGDMTEEVARRIGYQAPDITASDEGFFVKRDLVRFDENDPALVRRTELLSKTARHRILSESQVTALDAGDVLLPDYE